MTGHFDAMRLTTMREFAVGLEHSRREPWLDERQAAWCEMVAETGQRARHPLQRAQIADRAEQTQQRVVAIRQLKVAHVRHDETPGGILRRHDPHERRLDVETVYGESLIGEKPRVLAGAAANIEHRAPIRIETTQQAADLRDLGRVVLECSVDQVVVLRGGGEHRRNQVSGMLESVLSYCES